MVVTKKQGGPEDEGSQSNKKSAPAKKSASGAKKAATPPGSKKAATPPGSKKAATLPGSKKETTKGAKKVKAAAASPKKAASAGGATTSRSVPGEPEGANNTAQPGPSDAQRVDDAAAPAISTVPVRVSSIRVGTTSITKPERMTLYGITIQFGLAPNGEAYVRNLASGEGFELRGGRSVEGLPGTNWVPVVPGMQIARGEARIDCRWEDDTLVAVWLGPGDPLQRTTDAEETTAPAAGQTQSADTLAFMRRRSMGGGLGRPSPSDRGSHAERRTYDRPLGGPSAHDGKPVYRRDERLPRPPDRGSYGGGHRRTDEGPPPSRPAAHDRGGRVVRLTGGPRTPATPGCHPRRRTDQPISLNVFGEIILTNQPRELVVYFDSQGNTCRDVKDLRLVFGIDRDGQAYVMHDIHGEARYGKDRMEPGRHYLVHPYSAAYHPKRGDLLTLAGGQFGISFAWGEEWNQIVVRLLHPD